MWKKKEKDICWFTIIKMIGTGGNIPKNDLPNGPINISDFLTEPIRHFMLGDFVG